MYHYFYVVSTISYTMWEKVVLFLKPNYRSSNIAIGSRIKQIRKSAGLTQSVFAEKIDVSTQYISDLERGIVGASVQTIVKICDTLDVPADYVLRGVDPSTNQPVELLLEFQKYSDEQQDLILNGLQSFYKAFKSK